MDRNYRIITTLIIALITLSFFIQINSPTGFTVQETEPAEVSPGVEQALETEEEVAVIVTLEDVESKHFFQDDQEADIEEVKNQLGEDEFKKGNDLKEINAFSGEITEEALEKLKDEPTVKIIELDRTFSLSLADSLPLINATIMHNKILTNNITGKNTAVCVLDTGIDYNHAELSDNYISGYDYVNDDNDPMDDHGHGTHVSGIVEGVAPEAKIVHIKVLNSAGNGLESDIIAGINWCVSNKTAYNITAITMSLGAGLYTNYCDSSFVSFTSAVNNALANNLLVVASSGNDGSTTSISSPSCIQNVTAVGATDKSDNIASYSNRNSLLDLLAPGSSIVSTALGGGTTSMTGTSMAAPHVAGSFALAQQFEYEENSQYASPSTIESAFKNNGKLISSWTRIDVDNAIGSSDSISPLLIIFQPENITYLERVNLSINYTAIDLFLDTVWYNLNGQENITLSGNSSVKPEGGFYKLNLYANDTAGNQNSTSVSFGIDIPKVTINSPEDNYNDPTGNIKFNCSVTDLSSLSNISLYTNLSGIWQINQTINLSGTSATQIFTLSLTKSVFSWNCLAYDSAGNFDLDVNHTLRISTNSPPVINSFFPNTTSVTINEPNNQTFNISYSDPDGDSLTVAWYKNGASQSTSYQYNFSGSYSSSGTYNITATVSDSVNLTSNYWNFIVSNVEFCGDGVKNSTEACDGSEFGGLTCSSYGYSGGDLVCNNCIISTGSCTNTTSSGGSGGAGASGGGGEQFGETAAGETELVESEDVVFSESSQETDAIAEEPEIVEESPEEIQQEQDTSIGKIITGSLVAIIAGFLLFLFLKKEWKIIKNK